MKSPRFLRKPLFIVFSISLLVIGISVLCLKMRFFNNLLASNNIHSLNRQPSSINTSSDKTTTPNKTETPNLSTSSPHNKNQNNTNDPDNKNDLVTKIKDKKLPSPTDIKNKFKLSNKNYLSSNTNANNNNNLPSNTQNTLGSPTEPQPNSKNSFTELTGFKAASKNSYRSSSGPVAHEQNGYVIYADNSHKSALTNFDGSNLPVVQSPRSASMGIVNGTFIIEFKKYPANINAFAEQYDLKILSEAKNINTLFLKPNGYPTNLLATQDAINKNKNVKKSSLAISYGKRGPR